jgi:hypothetical protein
MYASSLPEPWIIAERERQRRIRDLERDDRPFLELPLPPPPRPDEPDEPDADTRRTVIVIEL